MVRSKRVGGEDSLPSQGARDVPLRYPLLLGTFTFLFVLRVAGPLLRGPTAKPPYSVGSLSTPTLIRPDNEREGWVMSHNLGSRRSNQAREDFQCFAHL